MTVSELSLHLRTMTAECERQNGANAHIARGAKARDHNKHTYPKHWERLAVEEGPSTSERLSKERECEKSQ